MKRHPSNTLLAISALAGALLLGACSDDATKTTDGSFSDGGPPPGGQYIKAPAIMKISLTVGQSHDLTIALATHVEATTYVDITNQYREFVDVVEPASLVIKYRAAERTKKVTLKGLKPTPNQGYVPITFRLRGTAESLTLKFNVRGVMAPDFGMQPDS